MVFFAPPVGAVRGVSLLTGAHLVPGVCVTLQYLAYYARAKTRCDAPTGILSLTRGGGTPFSRTPRRNLVTF